MRCDICGQREAVIFIQGVGAEGTRELKLCSQCARNHGLEQLQSNLGGILTELLKGVPMDDENKKIDTITKQKEKCPFCGISIQEIKKYHKAGCPQCWEYFSEVLFRSDKYPVHRGRVSCKLQQKREREQQLAQLQQLLQEAILLENYEQAAIYRDQIKVLEQGVHYSA
jgi:protein arginine kinase activator